MTQLEFTSKQGKQYTVKAPNPSTQFNAAYVFAFAKSGSTLLENMLVTYCQMHKLPQFSIFDVAFNQGIGTAEIAEDVRELIEQDGRIYSGFRHFPAFDLNVKNKKTVLLTRDPRDMLVSMYYSILKSHAIPKANKSLGKQRELTGMRSIDEDVLQRAKGYLNQFNRYQKMLEGSALKSYRYEDVIYKKQDWFADVLNHLGLPVNLNTVKILTKRFDIIPSTEKESEHIRQVHPGNYLKKLKPETIQQLNTILLPFLTTYGYELTPKAIIG